MNTINKARRDVNKEFCEVIGNKYREWCKRNGEEGSEEGLVKYMMRYNIIEERRVRWYMVVYWYPQMLYDNDGCKTRAIQMIEDKLGGLLKERHLWNVLNEKIKIFMLKKGLPMW